LFLCAPTVYAGDPARIGTAAGEQLLVPVGARDMAMGGASIANSTGLDAMYWNPAGLPGLQGRASAVFSTMQIFNDINHNYLAIGLNAGSFGTLGFSLKALNFGDIPVTTNADMDGETGQTFNPLFFTLGVTYAKRLTDAIQFGVTGKLVSEKIDRASGSAWAFDFGIQYHQVGGVAGLSLGLAVKNIGTNLKYTGPALLTEATDAGSNRQDFRERPTTSNQLPTTIDLGLGYTYNINEDNALLVTGLFTNNNFGNDHLKFGLEYQYTDLIALRGGYVDVAKTATDETNYKWALGAGVNVPLGNVKFGFDYAYRDSEYFDGNNMFSFILGW
jgi:hypothetical protein